MRLTRARGLHTTRRMAGSDKIKLLVITPERQVLDVAADAVVIPAHDGELGILADRAPLMCELGIGHLRYTQRDKVQRVFIDGGFAQVLENRVVVLTSRALRSEEVTPQVLGAAEDEARRRAGTDEAARRAHEQAQQRASVLRRISTD